jgi:long-chain acyl-CoA synthetase
MRMNLVRDPLRPEASSLTLMHMLLHSAQSNAAGEAVVVLGGVRLSYADLFASVTAFANELKRRGSQNDRVAVALPNSVDTVIAVLGAMASGAQAVLLNPFYTERELDPIITDADPLVVVCNREFSEKHAGLLARASRSAPISIAAPLTSLVRRAAVVEASALTLPHPQDLAILQYTGGTTGRSKGVNLTHRTTALNILQREALLPTRFKEERFLCMTPLFHSYATATSFFPTVYSAGCLVVMERYEPDSALKAIEEESITLFGGAPTIYNGLIAHPAFTRSNFSSLVGAYSGGAPLTVTTLTEWERVTAVPIAEGYGLTEATAVLCFNPLNGTRKPGSVGLPLPGTTIEVVDPEDGVSPVPLGQTGELKAKGPQLMVGYRNQPTATAEIIRDGWLYTGDIGEIDSDGYVYIRDRKNDMAIVAGYNVFPRELDELLSSHTEIVEAVSAGVPDAYRGEIMNACVKLRENSKCTEQDLIEFCSQNLARYKVPQRIFLVEEIAKTGAGKIDRKTAREWMRERAESSLSMNTK